MMDKIIIPLLKLSGAIVTGAATGAAYGLLIHKVFFEKKF